MNAYSENQTIEELVKLSKDMQLALDKIRDTIRRKRMIETLEKDKSFQILIYPEGLAPPGGGRQMPTGEYWVEIKAKHRDRFVSDDEKWSFRVPQDKLRSMIVALYDTSDDTMLT